MTTGREKFDKFQKLENNMFDRINTIHTGEDLCKYLEEYLRDLSSYKELSKISVDDYLFVLAGFVESAAAAREIGHGEPLWRSVAKILIYSLDRE